MGNRTAKRAKRDALRGPDIDQDRPVIGSPWSGNHLALVDLTDLTGLSLAWPATRAEAMSVPAFARARHVVCTTIARLPVQQYGADGVTPIDVAPVLVQPEVAVSRYQTLLWTLDDMLWHGRAYWRITETYASGWPAAVDRLPSDRVRLDDDDDTVWVRDRDGTEQRVQPEELIRIDGPHEGVLSFGARTIRHALSLERAAADQAACPIPAIELHQVTGTPDLAQPDINALLAQWRAARGQPGGMVGYTNSSLELRTHGAGGADALLVDGRAAVAVDAARLVGIPADAVDAAAQGGASMTYANVAQRARALIDVGLVAYIAALESRLSMDDVIPHGNSMRLATDALTRGDLGERVTALSAGITSGIYTLAEARALEHGTPWEVPA